MMHRFFANHQTASRRGFSFVEVMFAVIILGIGFVMVSAMFPVAIQQTQLNVEDATVSRVGLSAKTNFLTSLPSELTALSIVRTGGKISDLYYGWPISLPVPTTPPTGLLAGRVFSFRDSRAITTLAPLLMTYQLPPPTFALTTYQFPLASKTTIPGPVAGLWERIRGNLIFSADPQFAYVPLFQRGGTYSAANAAYPWVGDSTVNIYAFITAARNRTPYSYTNPGTHGDVYRFPVENSPTSTNDTATTFVSPPATLEPRLVTVTIYPRNGAQIVDQIVIQASNAGWSDSYLAAGNGGYVIISDDTNGTTGPTWPTTWTAGQYNGHVYRLGAPTELTPPPSFPHATFELQPGFDVSNPITFAPAGIQMQAFILGRAYTNPDLAHTTSANPYDGPVQDLNVVQFSLPVPK